jgi:adenylate cyclase
MNPQPRLSRLIDAEAASSLLKSYVTLWDDTDALSLIDARGRQIVGVLELDQQEFSRIWNAVRHAGAFITPERDMGAWPIRAVGDIVGMLVATGELPPNTDTLAGILVLTLETIITEALAKRAIAQETLDLYREINVLYSIGETLGAGLELEEVCRLILVESIKLIKCLRGAVLLVEQSSRNDNGSLPRLSVTSQIGMDDFPDRATRRGLALALDVVRSGQPRIDNEFQPEGLVRTPVVCAPLRYREDVLGAVFLVEKTQGGDFTAADEKLLFALATQAANSIENARLLDSIKTQRDEIATMKNHVDNIFASIASGVITTNMDDVITSYNRAAEFILSVPSGKALGYPYQRALSFLSNTPLPRLITNVQRRGRTYIDFEISSNLPARGRVHLNMSLSRLRGSAEEPLGVTIVMDDVTEKKKIERERRIVRRYLPPELVDSLPDNLDDLRLRGERQIITTLFADIRGFTSFSEMNDPETVVDVINRYFDMAAQAVRKHNGIIDKYLGDAVMALFNTPLLESVEHAWDAVQAAWDLKQAIERYHKEVKPELRLNYGVGIGTGEAVVGNVGAIDRMEYTAIGDAVNVTKRLQEKASVGQILMSRSAWERVKDRVLANPLPSVTLKGRRTATEVFELIGLKPTGSSIN